MEYIIPQPPTIVWTSFSLTGQFFKSLEFTFINLFKHNNVMQNGKIELPILKPHVSLCHSCFVNERFENKTFCFRRMLDFPQTDGN